MKERVTFLLCGWHKGRKKKVQSLQFWDKLREVKMKKCTNNFFTFIVCLVGVIIGVMKNDIFGCIIERRKWKGFWWGPGAFYPSPLKSLPAHLPLSNSNLRRKYGKDRRFAEKLSIYVLSSPHSTLSNGVCVCFFSLIIYIYIYI